MNTPVVWVLPEVFLRGFFWETAAGLFSYSGSLGSTVDTCMCCLVCFYGPLYLAATCLMLVLPEEYRYVWIILGVHFQKVPYSGLSGSTVVTYFFQFREAWWFSHAPSCRCRFRPVPVDGLVPEVDSGYTLMRQSTVTSRRISHIFLMKVDSDPVHELSG